MGTGMKKCPRCIRGNLVREGRGRYRCSRGGCNGTEIKTDPNGKWIFYRYCEGRNGDEFVITVYPNGRREENRKVINC